MWTIFHLLSSVTNVVMDMAPEANYSYANIITGLLDS